MEIKNEMRDEVALAEYPDRAAFMAMIEAPAFKAASHHREAGLEWQLNIESGSSMTSPAGSRDRFGVSWLLNIT